MPGKAGNRERSSPEGAARIDADYFWRGHTAGRAAIRTGGCCAKHAHVFST
jgi:hypothetical protein